MIEALTKKTQDRNLCLIVEGSGYVGLPTAALFAEASFHVITVDSGFSPINELVSRNVKAGRLKATLTLQKPP